MDLLAAFGMPRRNGSVEQRTVRATPSMVAPPTSSMGEPTPSMPSFAQTRFSPADLADRLPPRARAKLVAGREAKALAHAGLMEVSDRRDAERTLQQTAEQRLLSLKRDHRIEDARHPSVAEATTKRDKAKVEGARLQQIYDERAAAWQTLARLTENLERWLKGLRPDVKILEHTGPVPPLAKGVSPAKAAERFRNDVQRLVAELEQVERAPLPAAEARKLARDHVADLVKLGTPDVSTLLRADVDGKRQITYATAALDMRVIGDTLIYASVPEVAGFLAWFDRDKYQARLDAEIDRRADDTHALTDEQREARKRELAAAILEVERGEEFAIDEAEREGTSIPRRPDCDPRATLGLASSLPPPKNEW